MDYKCPKCNASLIKNGDDFICEYCKSEYNVDYLNNKKSIDYIIPFEIDKKTAINKYKQLIKFPSLTHRVFKSKKNIKKILGLYLPCYVYNLETTGEVEFECNKISTWKSSGLKYKKSDIYKVIRGGNINIKELPILITNDYDSNILDLIEPYDYNKILEFDESYIKDYKLCKSDKSKMKIKKDIEDKSKNIFVSEMIKDIKGYDKLKDINNSINLYNPSKKNILLPIWILIINYKDKKYKYIINGQTGKISGEIPINKNRIILIWLLLFILVFIVLLLFNFLKVML